MGALEQIHPVLLRAREQHEHGRGAPWMQEKDDREVIARLHQDVKILLAALGLDSGDPEIQPVMKPTWRRGHR